MERLECFVRIAPLRKGCRKFARRCYTLNSPTRSMDDYFKRRDDLFNYLSIILFPYIDGSEELSTILRNAFLPVLSFEPYGIHFTFIDPRNLERMLNVT